MPASSTLRLWLVIAILFALAGSAVAQTSTAPFTPVRDSELRFEIEPWFDDLNLPVATATVPDRAGQWLIVQLEGLALAVDGREIAATPFLDLSRSVTALAGEQGFFTVAVEPLARAEARGRGRYVFAAYTERDTGDLLISAFPVDEARWVADDTAEVELLRVSMPEPFHHGGQLRFGPDGYLYVSVGNGESSNRFLEEQPWSAASLATLRGKVLRIDPLPTAGTEPAYRVPDDNPFVAVLDPEVRPEIWALGFRNPWKFTFDPFSGDLIVVDVGDDRWEEVNRVVPGGNYGWPTREGFECFRWPDRPGLVDPTCPEADLEDPWIVYGHLALDPDGGQAVVGGVVVRDPELAPLHGRYLFSDFVTGTLWAYDPVDDVRERLLTADAGVTAVDEGPGGEVLVVSIRGLLGRLTLSE
jgi:glucose/arabinose dehydrogenase